MKESDILALSQTIWGEARGEGDDGMTAVAHVVLNRWRSGKWFDNSELQKCAYFALGAALGYLPDNTDGSTHYYAYDVVAPPNWASEATFVCRINRHEFHKGVN